MNKEQTPDAIVRFERVSLSYGENQVLKDFSLEVPRGQCLTIIGSSGCGKTTMLKMINGLLTPDTGRILVDGQDISQTDLTRLRRGIGYAIQNVGLFPHMTVRQNIAYVPSLSKQWDKETERRQVAELLKTVGLEEAMADRYPSELSGGQKQRVGIARALAAKPSLMLMDEPFGAVDSITRKGLQKELKRLHKELGLTILFVTHDIREAMALGDRILIMEAGKILRLDTPEAVKADPGSEFVARLLDEN
ncbi:MAG: ATP-binding cassette domain-containing protein [Lachnospiraceae bacterium]|jgi:osmoprotectant transport system ATP-binding protein|nr:ATP-binding cassette domain-containing protein [Lachnospiraceae bacterium]MDE6930902.1 ATP-binding cassette domain-containing protein [Lachnospiraceae bacterium]